MWNTVSTTTDAPRGRASTSSGQAPVLSATPGARGGQGPACDRPPGTVRVTPATLTGTSMADGSNAPSLGSVGSLFGAAYRPSGYLRSIDLRPSGCGKPGDSAGVRPLCRPSHPEPRGEARRDLSAGPSPLTGDRDGRRAARQGPRSIRSRRRKVAGLTSPPCDGTSAGWHGDEVGRVERGWRRGKGGKLPGLGRGGWIAQVGQLTLASVTRTFKRGTE
jgi:hypothetical protein